MVIELYNWFTTSSRLSNSRYASGASSIL